jgi:hypothetical protein
MRAGHGVSSQVSGVWQQFFAKAQRGQTPSLGIGLLWPQLLHAVTGYLSRVVRL